MGNFYQPILLILHVEFQLWKHFFHLDSSTLFFFCIDISSIPQSWCLTFTVNQRCLTVSHFNQQLLKPASPMSAGLTHPLWMCFAGDQKLAQRAADGHQAWRGDGDVWWWHGGRSRQQGLRRLRYVRVCMYSQFKTSISVTGHTLIVIPRGWAQRALKNRGRQLCLTGMTGFIPQASDNSTRVKNTSRTSRCWNQSHYTNLMLNMSTNNIHLVHPHEGSQFRSCVCTFEPTIHHLIPNRGTTDVL